MAPPPRSSRTCKESTIGSTAARPAAGFLIGNKIADACRRHDFAFELSLERVVIRIDKSGE